MKLAFPSGRPIVAPQVARQLELRPLVGVSRGPARFAGNRMDSSAMLRRHHLRKGSAEAERLAIVRKAEDARVPML